MKGPKNFSSEIAVVSRPLIREGKYLGTLIDFDLGQFFGRPKLRILFHLEELDIQLAYFCNCKLDENGSIIYPGRRAKLARILDQLPDRDGKMTLDNLLHASCEVTVATSRMDESRKIKQERDQYSVVTEFCLSESPSIKSGPAENPWMEADEAMPF
jgi:hypothetical protein